MRGWSINICICSSITTFPVLFTQSLSHSTLLFICLPHILLAESLPFSLLLFVNTPLVPTHSLTLSRLLFINTPLLPTHSLTLSPLLFINTPLLPTHSLPNSLHLFIYPSLFPALSLPHPLPSLYHFASLPAHACTVHTFWTLLFCLSKSFYFLLTLFHTHSALLHALPFSSFIPASASGSLSSTLSFSHAVPALSQKHFVT